MSTYRIGTLSEKYSGSESLDANRWEELDNAIRSASIVWHWEESGCAKEAIDLVERLAGETNT